MRITFTMTSLVPAGLLALVVTSACGSGGAASPPDDDAGSDAGPTCTLPEILCGATCIDVSTDPANCGACGKTCAVTQECAGGTCVDLCPTPAPDPSFTTGGGTLYAEAPITFTPAETTGVTYAWTFDGGTPATSTDASPVVTWSAAGTYAVTLQITSGKCVKTTTASVEIAACGGEAVFEYTGGVQEFVVPCRTSIVVDAYGAEGGAGENAGGEVTAGGLGGRAQARIPVTPGETLEVYVGGMGQSLDRSPNPGPGTGGFNGGGDVYNLNQATVGPSGGGGGASDVRRGTTLADRLIVAGGGGGGGYYGGGGAGGGLVGGDGTSTSAERPPGKGGTQSAGGDTGFSAGFYANQPGALGVGGRAYRDLAGSGGGGGGYYGGGAGGFCGGGGGSSWVDAPGNTEGSTSPGVRSGHGRVVITW